MNFMRKSWNQWDTLYKIINSVVTMLSKEFLKFFKKCGSQGPVLKNNQCSLFSARMSVNYIKILFSNAHGE